MLKQSMHSFVLLYPEVLLDGWKIEKVSERFEGEKVGNFLVSSYYSNWNVLDKRVFPRYNGAGIS